jgi:hypothetical protein
VHVTVPQERVVKPAEAGQDLQQVLTGGNRAVLVAEGERDPGGVRQRPRRVLRYGLFGQSCCCQYRAAAAGISGTRELGLYRRTRCRYS